MQKRRLVTAQMYILISTCALEIHISLIITTRKHNSLAVTLRKPPDKSPLVAFRSWFWMNLLNEQIIITRCIQRLIIARANSIRVRDVKERFIGWTCSVLNEYAPFTERVSVLSHLACEQTEWMMHRLSKWFTSSPTKCNPQRGSLNLYKTFSWMDSKDSSL